ncbi:MAG: AI-2E family transporter [Acidobacteriota bacterium]
MNDPLAPSRALRVLLIAASLAILAVALQWAQALLVPFLLSIFLAVIAASPVAWLRQRGAPNWLAVVTVVFTIMAAVVGLAVFVGRTINEFTSRIPVYQQRLQEELVSLSGEMGQRLSLQEILDSLEPGAVMNGVSLLLGALSGVLGNVFLIFFTVFFLLLEAASLPTKMQAAFGEAGGAQRYFKYFNRAADDLKRYLSLKTAISLLTGTIIALWATLLGVDFALLWGLVAFLLNFIPNIGSILAAVPAVLLAFIQYGLGRALVLTAGYVLVNIAVGNLIEPRIMGKRLGLSTLVVFLSLLFWGWIFGPVGMLLSAPLTLTIKIAMEANPSTRWFAILLGPEIRAEPTSSPEPRETVTESADELPADEMPPLESPP